MIRAAASNPMINARSDPHLTDPATSITMPVNHSNLHFVNLSTPNEGKDEETRKAVRTHVMQQYIQKKRLRDKNRPFKKPSPERLSRLWCTCRGREVLAPALSISNDESLRDNATCDFCHSQRSTVTKSPLNGNHGRQQQPATVYISDEGSYISRPVTALGAGRVDPFGVYPIEAHPYMHELVDHCMLSLQHSLSHLQHVFQAKFLATMV